MKLIRHSSNELRFEGGYDVWFSEADSIIHNGKKYTNTETKCIYKTVAEFKKESPELFDHYNYDFTELNYSIKIENNMLNMHHLDTHCNIEYSKNSYVNCIMMAFENGFLDNRIKNVYTQKGSWVYYPRHYKEQWNAILRDLEVDFKLYGYGFNNFICYTLNVKDIFLLNAKELPEDIIKIFSYNGINLKAKNKQIELIKLFNKQIRNYETSKQ